MSKKKLILTGKDLTAKDLYDFVYHRNSVVEISPEVLENIKKSHSFLEHHKGNSLVYGLNTGFGPMASYIINENEADHLQVNLVRSHATGMGEPIDGSYSLATMVVRLNTFLKGNSGVSVDLVLRLQEFINKGIIPVIYEHGAVGTSGDLVQLAHIALAIMGEGEVFYAQQIQATSKVIKKLGIKSYQLKGREGLAMINGTSVMSAIASIICIRASQLLETEICFGALSLELVGAFADGISAELHNLRPHKGQLYVASKLRAILSSSKLLRDRKILSKHQNHSDEVQKIPDNVQEVYSLRCLAQILGPVYEAIEKTREIVEIEINSVTDNPIVDWENEKFLHGGNFHGDYIAYAVDQLKMTLVKLSILSERRINFFLNTNVNKSFPPFLNLKKPGLTLALQGLQFVATSTTAKNQTLAFPQYIHSIPTNADNQDVVSMGTDAALFCAQVVENVYIVQVIEAVTLAQCVDVLGNVAKLSRETKKLFQDVRRIFPAISNDRVLTKQLAKMVEFLKSNP